MFFVIEVEKNLGIYTNFYRYVAKVTARIGVPTAISEIIVFHLS